jgi:hypothetical protein
LSLVVYGVDFDSRAELLVNGEALELVVRAPEPGLTVPGWWADLLNQW